MNQIDFIEDGHIYLCDGVRLPSVTQIIRHYIPQFYSNNELAKQIGIAVHHATALWDKGTLDWSSLDNRIVPQVTAWVDFCDVYQFKPLLIEEKLGFHMPESYFSLAGTLDRLGEIVVDDVKQLVVVDLKCSDTIHKCVEIQTAMYAMLYNFNLSFNKKYFLFTYTKIKNRIVVYLRSNGKFKVVPFKDKYDFVEANNMITLYNRHIEKKYIKGEG